MKKIILFVILLSCLSVTALGQSVCGDVNSDGVADIIDSQLISQYYTYGTSTIGPLNDLTADVNSDGSVDIIDALLVSQYYVGLIPDLDCSFHDPRAMNDIAFTVRELPVNIKVLDNDITTRPLLSITSVTDPDNGTAEIAGDKITYTPDSGFTGTDSFLYTVKDYSGANDIALVTVRVKEIFAVADNAFTEKNTAITIDVLANDLGENIQLTSLTDPGNGVAEIVADEILYTPDSGFFGKDTFGYTITDDNQNIATAYVGIEVTEELINLSFQDPVLQNCIYDSGYTYVHELITLSCPNQNITDLTGIEQCLYLQELILTNNNINNVSPLQNLESLKILDLGGNNIADISPISNISSLETLILANNAGIISDPLDNLGSLTKLAYLDVNNTGTVYVSTISSLPNLKTLIISNNQIYEFELLLQLQTLVTLDLSNTANTEIIDLGTLSNLPDLRNLYLARNNISDVSQLANLNLLTLDLRNNGIGNDDLANILSIEPLLDLDLSRNNISDIEPVVNANYTLMLDTRGNPIQSYGGFLFKIGLRYRKLDIFPTFPGNYRGDANGDNQIDGNDINMVDLVLAYLNAGVKYLPVPDNIACIDMDNNKQIDENDRDILSGMQSSGPDELLNFPCDDCYIKGDADGDGRVTRDDADLLDSLEPGKASLMENDRFAYNNGNYLLDGMTINEIRNKAIRREPLKVSCTTPEEDVISILTYDYDQCRWGALEGNEPINIPIEVIEELHAGILANPFIPHTDVVLLPEFAYSNLDNPVIINDESSPYLIINNNCIVKKVKELMQLAAAHELYIIVPLAEKKTYIVDGTECIAFLNSAIVINKQGEIEYIRRKFLNPTYCPPDLKNGLTELYKQDEEDSFAVMNLVSKRGDAFNAIMMICAEVSVVIPDDLQTKIDEAKIETGKETIDLFLFPAGMVEPYLPGNDIMKRIQYNAYDHSSISFLDSWSFYIYAMTSGYKDVADYIAYAGLGECNQGVYKMDKGSDELPDPIEYIYTNKADDSGFIFSRIRLIRPE